MGTDGRARTDRDSDVPRQRTSPDGPADRTPTGRNSADDPWAAYRRRPTPPEDPATGSSPGGRDDHGPDAGPDERGRGGWGIGAASAYPDGVDEATQVVDPREYEPPRPTGSPEGRTVAPDRVGGPGGPGGPDDPGTDTDTDEPGRPRRKKMSGLRKSLITVGVLLMVLIVGGIVAIQVITTRVLGDVERIPDVFSTLDESARPDKPVGTEKTLNFLLVGVDTRADEQTTGTDGDGEPFVAGRQRSDVIMVVHVAADRKTASIVSIPRDSWVPIPGQGKNKINAAFSSGGGALLIRSVEDLTGLRIDHFAVVDFAGFKDITDAVGGIDVRVAEETGDQRGSFPAGMNHLDGDQALVYVRQRYNLPQGDLDRVRRQQNAIKALMTKAGDRGMLANPARALRLGDSVARAVSVDDSLSNGDLRSLILSLRNLRPNAVKFITAPVRGFGREGKASVVYLDDAKAGELWTAVSKDDVTTYVKNHPTDALTSNPR